MLFRSDDVLIMPDGRRVGRLDPVFKSDLPIREAQIIQNTVQKVVIKFVPDEAFEESDAQRLAGRLRERDGAVVDIELRRVNRIPRTDNGKFRAVVNRVDENEIESVNS